MLTRHFSSFGSEFELLFANRAVRLYLGLADFDRGHRLDRRLRSRRVLVPRDHAVQFDLRQLLQKPIEPGPQQEIRHARRQRPKTRPASVVVKELEPTRLSAIRRPAAENDNRVERRPVRPGSP